MPEETPENQLDIVLEPIEQHTIIFYGKPLTVVRLPDGAPAVVFSHLCKNMGLERTAQLQRVQRKGVCHYSISPFYQRPRQETRCASGIGRDEELGCPVPRYWYQVCGLPS